MRYLLLTGDETDDDLRTAMINLRAEQRRQVIASTEREYAADVDELLDLLRRGMAEDEPIEPESTPTPGDA